MGLLDSVLGSLSQGGSGSRNALLDTVLSLVNNPQTGGLAGLLGRFQESGLGNLADSWVSTGRNLPLSADQIQQALLQSGQFKVVYQNQDAIIMALASQAEVGK